MMGYRILLAAVLSLPLTGVFAHGDEPHGEAPALSTNTHSLPSGEAHSPDFELVAQLQGDHLTVYLDNYSDNQPVLGATVEVESDSFKATLPAVAPGTYQVSASALNHPGEHSLLFTIVAGEQSDLLDTVLRVSAAETAPTAASNRLWWWGAAALLLAVAALLFKGRRRLGLAKQGVAPL
ncbi:MAG: hypothetical protein Q8R10_05915 [Pseudomonas sp.]|uniref:carboxypeptidase-like regulatory domain-containing protein n=1 Tax=Pseudomonas sp. TaxID=306 RepID=UPI00273495D9|nr:carboxypeptidase-like regulatory domain-containing protein [Pseudomonas sp.]MDP3845946.1 hypothetical protein [Pseudomonas sp.]